MHRIGLYLLYFLERKSKDEMHFTKCDVEPEEILPLI